MSSLIDAIHRILHVVVALLLRPLEKLSPLWGLTLVSIVLGVLLVLAYGKLSRQESIRKVKSQIYRALLESVLFRHDLKLSLGAQRDMLLQAARYFLLAVPPLIVLAIPCVLVLAQLGQWYEVRPMRVGESGIVRVQVVKRGVLPVANLSAPEGVEITPPVRDSSTGEIFWRVTPRNTGSGPLRLNVDGAEISMPFVSGDQAGPIVAASYQAWWEKILYPGGAVTKGTAAVSAIEISYPAQNLTVAGIEMHWIVFFFIVSLVAGLVGSKIFGVAV